MKANNLFDKIINQLYFILENHSIDTKEDLDILLSIVKSKVKDIHASGVCVVSKTPDITNARIEFENGCVANLTTSRISMKAMRKSRFFQQDAYISVDFLEKKAEVIKMKGPIAKCFGRSFVDGKLCLEATLTVALK